MGTISMPSTQLSLLVVLQTFQQLLTVLSPIVQSTYFMPSHLPSQITSSFITLLWISFDISKQVQYQRHIKHQIKRSSIVFSISSFFNLWDYIIAVHRYISFAAMSSLKLRTRKCSYDQIVANYYSNSFMLLLKDFIRVAQSSVGFDLHYANNFSTPILCWMLLCMSYSSLEVNCLETSSEYYSKSLKWVFLRDGDERMPLDCFWVLYRLVILNILEDYRFRLTMILFMRLIREVSQCCNPYIYLALI